MTDLLDSSAPLAELRELLPALCEGMLDSAGYARIEQLVQADVAATDLYIDYVWLHGELHWQVAPPPAGNGANDPPIFPVAITLDPAADALVETEPRSPLASGPQAPLPLVGFLHGILGSVQISPRTMMMMLAGALAGYFLVVMALIPLARLAEPPVAGNAEPGKNTRPARQIGRVVTDPQTRWSREASLAAGGTAQIGKSYELTAGRVELKLARGTHVFVEAPASFRLDSEQQVHLVHGKLRARVAAPDIGFAVTTPSARIVDLGTEFDVLVQPGGNTEVHVLRGAVEVKQLAADDEVRMRGAIRLPAGAAVSVAAGRPIVPIPLRTRRVESAAADAQAPGVDSALPAKIWLGNLFDDPSGRPLAQAIETDAYCATVEAGDLGIERVLHGGARPEMVPGQDWVNGAYCPGGLIQIAPDVSFDFANLGWHGKLHGSIANDSYGRYDNHPIGGLSTLGVVSPTAGPKIEEGIGMHADSLLTFDIGKIRAAGKLEGRDLEFICDRIGMNDDAVVDRSHASFRMIALVSDGAGVQAAIVDGQELQVRQQNGVWFVPAPPSEPMRADGCFFPLRVAIPQRAKYLTLVVTSFDDSNIMDHGVWSGARLEVVQPGAP